MVPTNSLDDSINIIAALISDVQQRHGLVFNTRALRLTLRKCESRARAEGIGFFTKSMLRLAKAFDKAIAGHTPLNAADCGFDSATGSKLPRFLGELFSEVLSKDGTILQDPDATCVKSIREILYLFSKYKLPYTDEQVQQVVSKFEKTENDLSTTSSALDQLGQAVAEHISCHRRAHTSSTLVEVTREAKILLSRVFSFFSPQDIVPRHGPGAVATRQQLWEKYQFTNVSAKIRSVYPLDAYFYASLGHVSDDISGLTSMSDEDLPARVLLVPKDSRGPRLISCEPVDYQWVQQGLGRSIVEHVENNVLTKYNVFFTDQGPNQRGALLGSSRESGNKYATLDLNEASDRITLSLVRLLFPEHIRVYLEACRSSSTTLPNGKVITLQKYAPMGSCLCFPVLALSVWAILTAGAPDADTRESILVYGDDVVVPTAYAANAMKLLESFGLKINQDKSCTAGLFRESCGTDAFNGVNVTPVRLRTVWASSPSPDVYTSWIAYANQFYDRRHYRTYDYIVSKLVAVYGRLPEDEQSKGLYPSLREVPAEHRLRRKRWNVDLQKIEHRVYTVSNRPVNRELPGWLMLLRYFTEGSKAKGVHHNQPSESRVSNLLDISAFAVRQYTKRKRSMLRKRWR